MNISHNSNCNKPTFGIKISDSVNKLIQIQANHETSRTRKLANSKIAEIKDWIPLNAELVLARNRQGKIKLGMKQPLNKDVYGVWYIENLSGRTILSNLLNLHKEDLIRTARNICYLYEKYGNDVFKQAKVTTIYDKVRGWQS